MKVGTLKKKLAKLPQDLPVWALFPEEGKFVYQPVVPRVSHDYSESGNCRLYFRHYRAPRPLTVASFREDIRICQAPNTYPVTDPTGEHHFNSVEERDGKVRIS